MPSSYSFGRFNRFVEQLFNIKGGATLQDVERALRINLSINTGVEERHLLDIQRYITSASPAPVAAQFSQLRFRNPVGSNVLAVFEQITYAAAAVDSPRVSLLAATTDLGTILTLTLMRMDPRGNPAPTMIGSQGSVASLAAGAVFQGNVIASVPYDFVKTVNQEYTLLPGDTLQITSNVVNQGFSAGVMWRERPLEQSELT